MNYSAKRTENWVKDKREESGFNGYTWMRTRTSTINRHSMIQKGSDTSPMVISMRLLLHNSQIMVERRLPSYSKSVFCSQLFWTIRQHDPPSCSATRTWVSQVTPRVRGTWSLMTSNVNKLDNRCSQPIVIVHYEIAILLSVIFHNFCKIYLHLG